jgi:hypothetical protein
MVQILNAAGDAMSSLILADEWGGVTWFEGRAERKISVNIIIVSYHSVYSKDT